MYSNYILLKNNLSGIVFLFCLLFVVLILNKKNVANVVKIV